MVRAGSDARRIWQDLTGKKLPKSFSEWIEFLYGPFFRVIGFFYRSYTANRARIAKFTGRRKIAAFIRAATVVILIVWLLIWLFASDENRTRLTDEFQQSIEGIKQSFDR